MCNIPVERYSTAQAAPGSGLAYWNVLACETFNSLVVDADDPGAFHGVMVRAPLGELTLMSAHSAAAQVSRINDPTRAARGPKWFDIHFQLSGRSANSQGGREAILEPGDFTLCDATQQLYLGLPSWHEDWQTHWEKKRERNKLRGAPSSRSPR